VYLERIKSPSDLKLLNYEELKRLACEVREELIYRVSKNGGHLASNLGVVELSIAIHYVFNSPSDKIIWDVGHQSYTHKLLTGRYDRFSTLRRFKGISGFPRRQESEHDPFGTGHSSTSISAAVGIIEGRDKNKDKFKVVAVIGDGAMTAGLAFEGLNNAGELKKDLIVILNDNEMSISHNVGAISSYLNRILIGERFQKFKKDTKAFLEGIPKLGDKAAKIAQKTEEVLKGFFLPGIIFEELGFNYVGPIDGHNLELLIETLKRVSNSTTPILLHVITKKGKGYEFSESNPSLFHGVGPFKIETGTFPSDSRMTYSEVFGDSIVELAKADDRIIAITAAMKEGTGLSYFAKKYPERFYDVGIAEAHAVTFAAGLATQGFKPVVAIYSTFLQRAYDEIIHDVCLQNLHVIFILDRAGIVGDDGPTHNGMFDLSYLRHIPNIVVMAPKNGKELQYMLKLALKHKGPVAIRFPRGRIPYNSDSSFISYEFGIGEAEILKDGKDVALISIGSMVYPSLKAAQRLEGEGISTMVINSRFVKPLDSNLIINVANKIPIIVTVEENVLLGGFGSAVLELINDAGLGNIRVKRIGIPDEFVEQGDREQLLSFYGIDEDGIYNTVINLVKGSIYKY
jgi:1-deoxy-D-xylulose-5-phosphate synthase